MSDPVNERKLSPRFDRKGNPEWSTTTSPPDTSVAVVSMVPDRIIPIIFVPGVMGSNLKGIGRAKDQLWRLDSERSMAGWIFKDARARKLILTPTTMVLDNDGARPTGTQQHDEELKRRGWGEVGAMSYSTFLVWLENALNDHHAPEGGEREQLLGVALGATKGEAALLKNEIALSYRYRFPMPSAITGWTTTRTQPKIFTTASIQLSRGTERRKRCVKR